MIKLPFSENHNKYFSTFKKIYINLNNLKLSPHLSKSFYNLFGTNIFHEQIHKLLETNKSVLKTGFGSDLNNFIRQLTSGNNLYKNGFLDSFYVKNRKNLVNKKRKEKKTIHHILDKKFQPRGITKIFDSEHKALHILFDENNKKHHLLLPHQQIIKLILFFNQGIIKKPAEKKLIDFIKNYYSNYQIYKETKIHKLKFN